MTLGWKELKAKKVEAKEDAPLSRGKVVAWGTQLQLSPKTTQPQPQLTGKESQVPAAEMSTGHRRNLVGYPKKVYTENRGQRQEETHTCRAASKGCSRAHEQVRPAFLGLAQTANHQPRDSSLKLAAAAGLQLQPSACQAEHLSCAALTAVCVREQDTKALPQ